MDGASTIMKKVLVLKLLVNSRETLYKMKKFEFFGKNAAKTHPEKVFDMEVDLRAVRKKWEKFISFLVFAWQSLLNWIFMSTELLYF